MIYLKRFSELSKSDAAIAGGKGASLGEMTKAGIPVPPGFVVLASTFDKFLELAGINTDIDSIIRKVNHREIHTVEQASNKIKAIILGSVIPKEIEVEIKTEFKKLKTKYVAVRSSATAEDSSSAAWAGQLDSFLNTNEGNLLENVKKCWASLFTPRAIFYRFEKKLHKQKISVAVVVQKMVDSEVSGIAFSVHPVTEDYNQIIIEAGFGLGEAIVSGQITPDSYVIAKDNLKILDKNIYTQERGIYRSKDNKSNQWVNIANKKGSSQCLSDKQIIVLSKLIINIENHYGFPCDIEWAMEGGDFYIVQSRPITTLINNNEKSIDIKKFKETTKDRVYISQQGDISIALLGNCCNTIQGKYVSVYGYNHVRPILTLQKGNQGVCYFDLEMYRDFSRVAYSKIKDDESVYDLPEYKDYKEISRIIDSEYINFIIPKNINEAKEKISYYFELAKKYLASTLFCEAVDHQIVRELANNLKVKNVNEFIETSILPTKSSFVNHQNQLLLDDKDISWSFTNYFAAPDKAERLKLVEEKRSELVAEETKNEVDKNEKAAQLNRESVEALIKKSSPEQKKLIGFIQTSISMRDERKEFVLKLFTILSDSLRYLAKELNISYDAISAIADTEIIKLDDALFLKTLTQRSEKGVVMISYNDGPRVEVIDYDFAKSIIFDESIKGKILEGICANKGKYVGIVRVIVSEKDFYQFKEGEILVTGMTRAEYVPLMRKAGAIITDEGGVTCHAAIISRELGKPCIINTRIATQVLKNGDLVEVDANQGIIKLLDSEKGASIKEASSNNDEYRSSLIKKIKTVDWDIQRFNAYPFYLSSVAMLSGFNLPWGLSYTHFLCISQNNNVQWHYDKEDYKRIGEFFWDKVTSLRELQSLIKEYRHNYALAKKNAKYSEGKLNKLSINELIDLLKKQIKLLSLSAGTAHIVECASFVAEQKLLNEYRIDPLSIVPARSSFLKKAAAFAHQLVDAKRGEVEIVKEFNRKYAWIKSSYLGRNPINYREIVELANKDESPQALKIDKKSKGAKPVFVSIFSHLFSWQDERKANILKSIYTSQPILDALAERLKMSKDSIMFLLPEEVEQITNKDFQNILKKRAQLFVDYAQNKKDRLTYTGPEANIIANELTIHHSGDRETLKGQSAFKGVVKGVARVCLSLESIGKFNEGEVLVASMTRPEYIPAMRRAVAFVTDEGGITCHAAIVAREMKKPCVIGTKIATKVIKDGDIVEVDADNGVVKILNKVIQIKNHFNRFIDGYQIQAEGGRAAFYLLDHIIINQYLVENKDWPLDDIFVFSSSNDHNAKWFRLSKGQQQYQGALDKFINKPQLVDELFMYLKSNRDKTVKILNETRYSNLSNSELADFFDHTISCYYKVLRVSTIIRLVDLGLINRLKIMFAGKEDVNEYLSLCSASEEKSFVLNEEIALLELASEVNEKKLSIEDKSILDKLSNIYKKYCFSELGYFNEKIKTLDDYINKLSEYIESSPNERLKKINDDFEKIIEKRQNLINELSAQERVVVDIASRLSHVKDIYKLSMNKVLYSSERLFSEIADRVGRSVDYIKDLSPDEIKSLLNDESIDEAYIAKRLASRVVIGFEKTLYVLTGEDAVNFKNKYLNIDKSGNSYFGRCASNGHVAGKARIILSPKDFHKMIKGEILVVMNTSPDFTPIMKKAQAIIAEEGGLTAHVSIVSRELGIPSVVGVSHITEILKDGDEVEVDANNGVVRIINRAKLSN